MQDSQLCFVNSHYTHIWDFHAASLELQASDTLSGESLAKVEVFHLQVLMQQHKSVWMNCTTSSKNYTTVDMSHIDATKSLSSPSM